MTLKHPRLAHALMHLRPGAKPLVDFVCVDNGDGPELEEGSMVNPPTQAEVDAVADGDLDFAQVKKAGIGAISDRQFFQQLAIEKIISTDEALAAVQVGAVPQALANLISSVPDKFSAEMILSGATSFERNHPLTDAIGQAYGWSPDQIDRFFLAASRL